MPEKKKIETKIKSPVLTVKKLKPDLRKEEKPLIDVKVTNPITYIKSWWKRIIGNEGIELKIKVRPLTAIAIAIIVLTVSLGIGRFNLPFRLPFFEYSLKEEAFPKNFLFRETGFVGTLKFDASNRKYYLITESSEAINLEVPNNVELSLLVGKRIFATGKYYQDTRTLKVKSASDLEILPTGSENIPTMSVSLTPTNTPVATPTLILTPTSTSEPTPTSRRFPIWR